MQGQIHPATVQGRETKAEDQWYRWDIREGSWSGGSGGQMERTRKA